MKRILQESCKEIVADLLDEIKVGISKRPKGQGITSQIYIEDQLTLMWDLLNGVERYDEVKPALRWGLKELEG